MGRPFSGTPGVFVSVELVELQVKRTAKAQTFSSTITMRAVTLMAVTISMRAVTHGSDDYGINLKTTHSQASGDSTQSRHDRHH
jgi:hypothetical protein